MQQDLQQIHKFDIKSQALKLLEEANVDIETEAEIFHYYSRYISMINNIFLLLAALATIVFAFFAISKGCSIDMNLLVFGASHISIETNRVMSLLIYTIVIFMLALLNYYITKYISHEYEVKHLGMIFSKILPLSKKEQH